MSSSEEFALRLLRIASAQMILESGFIKTHTRCVDVIADVFGRYLELLGNHGNDLVASANRLEGNMLDIALVFEVLGVDCDALYEYGIAAYKKAKQGPEKSTEPDHTELSVQTGFPRLEPASFPIDKDALIQSKIDEHRIESDAQDTALPLPTSVASAAIDTMIDNALQNPFLEWPPRPVLPKERDQLKTKNKSSKASGLASKSKQGARLQGSKLNLEHLALLKSSSAAAETTNMTPLTSTKETYDKLAQKLSTSLFRTSLTLRNYLFAIMQNSDQSLLYEFPATTTSLATSHISLLDVPVQSIAFKVPDAYLSGAPEFVDSSTKSARADAMRVDSNLAANPEPQSIPSSAQERPVLIVSQKSAGTSGVQSLTESLTTSEQPKIKLKMSFGPPSSTAPG